MEISNLFTNDEERAVSPVIGVILMVAITVILAAVIASFVLGLGDQQEVAPTANFDFSYDSSAQEVTVTHTNGDNIIGTNLYIRGENFDPTTSGDDVADDGQWTGGASATIDGNTAVTSGDSATVDLSGGSDPAAYVIRVNWQSSDGSSSSELSSDRGPDA